MGNKHNIINHSVENIYQIKQILDTLNCPEYNLINYVWVEYGFYPIFFNELFLDFFKNTQGPKIGLCFEGHEIFYEPHVDILITLKTFIDTTKTYINNKESELLLHNFKNHSDRGVAFWYTLRNFDEDEYWNLISKYDFRNIIFPIGKDTPWTYGMFPCTPNLNYVYGEGKDGKWILPSCRWFENAKVSWDINLWNNYFEECAIPNFGEYNTFFVKNTWKSRNFGSHNINDFLINENSNIGNFNDVHVDYEIYEKLISFHIQNKINLVIFHDLVKFPIVENEYIHYINMVGHFNVRLFLSIVNHSQNFITTGTSPSDLVNYYCKKVNMVLLGDDSLFPRLTFVDELTQIKKNKVFKFHKNYKNYQELFSFLLN